MNQRQLSIPNSNAFVDIDGDCLSDLVVSTINDSSNTAFLEIWLNSKGSFSLNNTIQLKEGVGITNFGDMDGSGTIDFVIPVCKPFPTCSEENSIYIIYNSQLPLCKYLWDKGATCRPSSDLCVSDPHYTLVSSLENVTNSKVSLIILFFFFFF